MEIVSPLVPGYMVGLLVHAFVLALCVGIAGVYAIRLFRKGV